MKSYAAAAGLVFAAFFVLFLLGEVASVPLLTDPSPWLHEAGVPPALVGVGLLVVDAALPVPASLVMIALGAVYGAVLGTLLAAIGTMGATLVGFALGRRGRALLDHHASLRGREQADHLLKRWGVLAIVLTRPVPLLAETTAVLAGASSLGWERATVAALAGAVPTAGIYALTGAAVFRLGSGALVFVAVLAVAGCMWFVGRAMERRIVRDRTRTMVKPASGMTS